MATNNKNFFCELCNYNSNKNWDIDRHLKSTKHITNIKKSELNKVKNGLNCKQNIEADHKKILEEKEKRLGEKDKIIKEDRKRFREKDKIIEEERKRYEEDRKRSEEDRERIRSLESQLASYHNMFSHTNLTQPLSIMQYVVKNYNNAPHLTIFANCDKEKKELEQKELEKHEQNKKLPINKYAYAEQLISYYINDKLITVISNSIIAEYKKADPSKQAVWTSDTSRLTYLIKQLLKDDTSNWVIDKKGVETCKYIVNPLLKFIKDDLVEYNLRPLKNTSDMASYELELQSRYMQNGQKIISLIDSNILKTNILKEITPAFYMSHNKGKPVNKIAEVKTIDQLAEVEINDELADVDMIEELAEVKLVDETAKVKLVDEIAKVKFVDKVPAVKMIDEFVKAGPVKKPRMKTVNKATVNKATVNKAAVKTGSTIINS